jgi:hypothetical protein
MNDFDEEKGSESTQLLLEAIDDGPGGCGVSGT